MKKAKFIECKEVDKETIIVNYKKNEFYILNETGTFIWKKINGKNTEKKIAEALAKNYGITRKEALSDTKKLIKKLNAMELIQR
jgi:hypothetical protein